jgi:probable HAF family extracellular repeat protein
VRLTVAFTLLVSGWLGVTGHTGATPLTYAYTPINVPDSSSTVGHSLNNAGQIVGAYTDSAGEGHGFLYSSGTYTTLDVPGGRFTTLLGINNVGQIVGTYRDSSNTFRLSGVSSDFKC